MPEEEGPSLPAVASAHFDAEPSVPAFTPLQPAGLSATPRPAPATRGRGPRAAWRRAGFALVTVALLATAGYFAAKRFWPRSAPGDSRPAQVAVESTPAGLNVFIDGGFRGQTPVRLELPAGQHHLVVEGSGVKRELLMSLSAGADVARYFDFGAVAAPSGTGSIDIQTQPAGARVIVNGQVRGVSPVTVSGLAPGVQEVFLIGAQGSVAQRVTVEAGRTATLVVPLGNATQPGWLRATAAIPLRILEGGRVLGTTESERTLLPAGRHDFEFVNEQYEVRLARSVAVPAGREITVAIELPTGRVNVNAQPWAEVWVGGQRLGETPLGNVSLPVGQHEFVFRHPQLGERRQTAQVRAATPTRVWVSFAQ